MVPKGSPGEPISTPVGEAIPDPGADCGATHPLIIRSPTRSRHPPDQPGLAPGRSAAAMAEQLGIGIRATGVDVDAANTQGAQLAPQTGPEVQARSAPLGPARRS